jgi:hypothetical protein
MPVLANARYERFDIPSSITLSEWRDHTVRVLLLNDGIADAYIDFNIESLTPSPIPEGSATAPLLAASSFVWNQRGGFHAQGGS